MSCSTRAVTLSSRIPGAPFRSGQSRYAAISGIDRSLGPAVALRSDQSYPTSGPENRFKNILFVEKEGFNPLLETARIAEQFDIAIMSTKGMSVTASRMLIDRLAPQIDKVLILHDFDVSGFSIFSTLGGDGRRYRYKNKVPIFDIGLRLPDVEAMGLQSEPVTIKDWDARRETLIRHGATREEIEFLRERRVELNEMTSRQFIDFLETKFAEHGVEKVIPDAAVIEKHARRLIEQRLARKALADIRQQLADEAARVPLPDGIEARLREHLAQHPDIAWDEALAMLVGGAS